MSRPARVLWLAAVALTVLGLVGTCVGSFVYERRRAAEWSAKLLPAGAHLLGSKTLGAHLVVAWRAPSAKLLVALVHPRHPPQSLCKQDLARTARRDRRLRSVLVRSRGDLHPRLRRGSRLLRARRCSQDLERSRLRDRPRHGARHRLRAVASAAKARHAAGTSRCRRGAARMSSTASASARRGPCRTVRPLHGCTTNSSPSDSIVVFGLGGSRNQACASTSAPELNGVPSAPGCVAM
jgi:hypothetical protein